MNILDFDETEFEKSLQFVEESGEDVSFYIENSFTSLLFLGKNLNSPDRSLYDCAIFNIRLCYVFYKKNEDYKKLAEIVALVKDIEGSEKRIVDLEVLENIVINVN